MADLGGRAKDKTAGGPKRGPASGGMSDAQNPGEGSTKGAPTADRGKAQALHDAPAEATPAAEALVQPAPKKAPAAASGIIRQHELVEAVRAYDADVDEKLLDRAYVFSMRAHGGQTRKSGDPYFTHPLAVAAILTELKADPASIATALLHDVVEDTDVTVDDIAAQFGPEIARLVEGVTKLSKIDFKSDASKQAENFGKLVVAMADDVRVLLVKLADRLHNMRTLHHFDNPEKRKRIALETMEIYAPLASRIGVQRIREELEDLSFRELSVAAYETITHRLEDLHAKVWRSVVELSRKLKEKLAEAGVAAEVTSREKRPYSIWRKMAAKNATFDELADIYAFRVIVPTVADCYRALGVIHTNWPMIPTEFDDYVSTPKPNNYRSIHTAVIGPPTSDGGRQRIEIQIRTAEMHETAERGVAAHWRYKTRRQNAATEEGGFSRTVEIVSPGAFDPYETPRKLVEMFQTGDDPEEALRYAKLELFQDQVFCFTPKGLVIALPKGATGLDFAYAVHTDLGDTCIGVKINGVSKPMRTPLKNGDVVVILNNKHAEVPAGWESMIVTGKARAGVRRRIRRMKHEQHIEFGRHMAESVFAGAQLELSPKAIRAAVLRLGETNINDVFAKVGRGDLKVSALVEAAYPGVSHEAEGEIRPAGMAAFKPRLAIDNLPPGVNVMMGQCCSPLPGERIFGIRDEADNLTVHAIDCPVGRPDEHPETMLVDLKWHDGAQAIGAYAKIIVTVRNGVGVLTEVAAIIARYGVSIENIRLENRAPDFVDLRIDAVVKDVRQLENMLSGLRVSTHVLNAVRDQRKANETV